MLKKQFPPKSFKTVKGTFLKNRYKPKSQNVVCSNRYDTLYPTGDSDESDCSSDAETLSSGSTSSNISNYSNSKKKERQHKKRKINSTAGEILMENHNENHAIHKRKQIRSKHKLTSSEIKIIDKSVLPQKKKTQVNRNLIKLIKTGKTQKWQTDYRQHLIMQQLEEKRKWSSLLIVY